MLDAWYLLWTIRKGDHGFGIGIGNQRFGGSLEGCSGASEFQRVAMKKVSRTCALLFQKSARSTMCTRSNSACILLLLLQPSMPSGNLFDHTCAPFNIRCFHFFWTLPPPSSSMHSFLPYPSFSILPGSDYVHVSLPYTHATSRRS